MNFKQVQARVDLPYKADKTLLSTEGSLEEFAQFISKFANEEGKEIVFFSEDKNSAHAFIEEDSTVYLFEVKQEELSQQQSFKGTSKLQEVIDKSKLFVNSLIVIITVLASCLPTV